MREVLVMITTVSNEEIARNISNSLIEKKLAACISLKKISSIYKWGGDIEEAEEIEITIKSKLELKDNLIEALQNMTTYEMLKGSFLLLEEALEGKPLTMINLVAIDTSEDNKELQYAIRIYKSMIFPQLASNGLTDEDTVEIASFVKRFDRALNYFKTQSEYYYNADFDPRSEIVGDD